MKKLFLIFFVLVSISSFSQVEKGKYLVGGSADFSLAFQGKNNSFNLSLSPQFSAFVINGLAIGARYSFGISATHNYDFNKKEYVNTSTFTSGIGPLIRGYIGKNQLKGLLAGSASYLTSTTLRKSSVSGTSGFNLYGIVGIAYFFNPHLSLETGFYISATGYEKQLPVTRGGFSVGFSVFLDNKKKENPLMNDSKEFKTP